VVLPDPVDERTRARCCAGALSAAVDATVAAARTIRVLATNVNVGAPPANTGIDGQGRSGGGSLPAAIETPSR
jgi:hypothetical protein